PRHYTHSRRLVIVVAVAIVWTICHRASVIRERLLCITSTYTLEIVIDHILCDLLPEHCSILTRSPEVDTGENTCLLGTNASRPVRGRSLYRNACRLLTSGRFPTPGSFG